MKRKMAVALLMLLFLGSGVAQAQYDYDSGVKELDPRSSFFRDPRYGFLRVPYVPETRELRVPLHLPGGGYPPVGTKPNPTNNLEQVPVYRLYNGKEITMDEIKETQRLINHIVAKTGKGAYVKFSDGSVISLAQMLHLRYGLIPRVIPTLNTNHVVIPININQVGNVVLRKDNVSTNVILIDSDYTVHEVTADGCRITCNPHPWHPDYTNIFVQGFREVSDKEYMMLRLLGSYTYTTVNGGSRRIPKFEIGIPCTRDDYLEYIKGH